MKLQCLTCGGTYESVLPDGLLYFHRCPPLSARELAAAIDAGTVQLSKQQTDHLQAARDADAKHPPTAEQIPQADLVLASISVDRPNVRDENVTVPRDPREKAQPKAAGAGTRPAP